MKILWIKDGIVGHEKQVQNLLNELSKSVNLKIFEANYHDVGKLRRFWQSLELFGNKYKYMASVVDTNKRVKLNTNEINLVSNNNIDILIGAGSKPQLQLLRIKEYFEFKENKNLKIISILSPSLHKDYFDVICAPKHDNYKFKSRENIIFFNGSLSRVSDTDPDQNIGFIGVGGKNKHYIFNEKKLLKQIEYVVNLYPKKKWNIFTTRRTPKTMTEKLNKLSSKYNLIIDQGNYDELIEKASVKIVTQDSVNMVYECLSTKGKTYLFNMKYWRKNKVVNQINDLLENENVGYISFDKMADGLTKISLQSQNPHYEVFAEVEKVAYKLIKKLGLDKKII